MDTIEQIDISDAESAEVAANRTVTQLRHIAETVLSQDGVLEVSVRETDSGQWVVSWPGGPHNWVNVTGGDPICSAEPEIVGFGEQDEFIGEVKNQTSLVFTPE